jgi:hypothetical protein
MADQKTDETTAVLPEPSDHAAFVAAIGVAESALQALRTPFRAILSCSAGRRP